MGLVSFVERFKDATIGFSGYPRLARLRSGAFAFMAVLLFLAVGIAGTITTVQMSRLMAQVSQEILRGPDFALRDGQFHFEGEMPYRMGDEEYLVVIVDTTGQTAPEALRREPPSSLLITRTALYQVDPLGTLRKNDLSLVPAEVTRHDVVAVLGRFHRWVPVLYLLIYVFQLGFKVLEAFILGAVAVRYGRAMRWQVSMGLGFTLGLYAMSLGNVLQWVLPNFRTYTATGAMVWWGLSLVYLLQGLRACASAGLLEPAESGPRRR